MSSRKTTFVEGELYHVYNRGVDKRDIFLEKGDVYRFVKCMKVLNTTEPIGSLFKLRGKASQFREQNSDDKLVDIVCFALLPNHYHLILRQVSEKGISLFMHRLGTAHAMFFNDKYDRSGALFQGKFKAIHVSDNSYLLHLSSYVNRNPEVHRKWEDEKTKLSYTSYPEYCGEHKTKMCAKNIILDQFSTVEEYKRYTQRSLESIRLKRDELGVTSYLLETLS